MSRCLNLALYVYAISVTERDLVIGLVFVEAKHTYQLERPIVSLGIYLAPVWFRRSHRAFPHLYCVNILRKELSSVEPRFALEV